MYIDRVAPHRLPKGSQNGSESWAELENQKLQRPKYLQSPRDMVGTLQQGGRLAAGGALVVSCSLGYVQCLGRPIGLYAAKCQYSGSSLEATHWSIMKSIGCVVDRFEKTEDNKGMRLDLRHI